MKLVDTGLPEVKIVEPDVFGDARGFFMESWHAEKFAEAGISAQFVQDNHSRSAAGVLRGIHYQLSRPQGKLVRVTAGRVFDVAVDLRRSSARFREWVGVELSAENHRMLWVPPGFGHAFLSLADGTDLLYKCTDFYAPELDRSLIWSDADLAIAWPLDGLGEPQLSEKDRNAPRLAEAEVYP